MALDIHQQIRELIKKSKNILVTTSAKDPGDGVCSALAFLQMLEKMNKPADAVLSSTALKKLGFLPGSDKAKTAASSLKKFTISLDISNNKIHEFSYDIKDNKLNIFITPEKNDFTRENITCDTSGFKYDLIIVIGSPDFESLGNIYANNTDFFYSTAVINIDTDPANEYFGQINLVDLNAVSPAEIIFNLMRTIDIKLLDYNAATQLLAGIIIKTKSFKDSRTTPKSFAIAAELIKIGAARDVIISNLYGNKKLTTLNLWGRVLARLKQDSLYKMAWSMVSQTDFEKAGAREDDLQGVVEELLSSTPNIEIVLILYETTSGQIAAELHTSQNYNALELARAFDPLGIKSRADFFLETDKLLAAEEIAINQIRKRIKID
ncbi:hypothetical protein COV56_01815 [Candidatus Kuenenbacteria bacterium CG11_big_fil_rev_8_21_14_0_20_37_9]|uniref:DDH domain-containing protein n=2 Tax=Candidatus Kueneniibacteriota TaxID=1752740 RepID=A0A2M6XS26_9BACT|nr:MAG: hypothetical protein AUJ29_00195 [Candidatus Kuenenbacteria bacterium CG1_02_38_13]PIR05621.1 MAG: hypothetical protein COV56_01815 [Candidatus Kuenenbacteria bacterium CG11_big_fil_rev_8_21_14_0_20_37_9]PIU10444.1 MAG: hypothetical protein COT27_03180 [Candidatus Kuenenbacteria bacterium CG08_land_8_20_14_0_20_37_23]